MNVIFFMQDTGAIFGAERATLDLAAGLKAAGESPHFYLITELRRADISSTLAETIEQEGFPLTRFPIQGRLSRALAQQVKRAFAADQGDVLHVIGSKANVHAWWSGIHPVVATVHGWLFRKDLKERVYDGLDRWCLKRCDAVICLSTYYETLLLGSGVHRNRLSRIASGLREIPAREQLPKAKAPGQPLTFGMLGRFSEEKNHRMFLAAAQEVVSDFPAVRFRVAGQGPLRDDIVALTEQMGLKECVEMCGYQEVDTFMAEVDVYVLCSKIENLPYSILEAMAWGRPVIGTRVGGVPDLVVDGETGWLVDPGNVKSLANAMKQCLQNPDLAHSRGLVGRARLEKKFILNASVLGHLEVYRRYVV